MSKGLFPYSCWHLFLTYLLFPFFGMYGCDLSHIEVLKEYVTCLFAHIFQRHSNGSSTMQFYLLVWDVVRCVTLVDCPTLYCLLTERLSQNLKAQYIYIVKGLYVTRICFNDICIGFISLETNIILNIKRK